MTQNQADGLHIGWAAADLTPAQPVLVTGQFHARVSEGVMDPITATALAIESGQGASAEQAVLVSCDVVAIPEGLLKAIRLAIRRLLPELPPDRLFLNATHTHTGPEVRVEGDVLQFGGGNVPTGVGVDLPVMAPADYAAFAAERIADAVARAWNSREPGGIGFGLGHAVVGHNRRICYTSGESRMYGATGVPEFSHVEGYEDHSVNVLAVWNRSRILTGLVVNLACPSQVSENSFLLSADYWHETRTELRRRFGQNLFVLPQCSAAGDQSPHLLIGQPAEERMWRLLERTERQDIGMRIADAIAAVLPAAEKELDWNPRFVHRVATMELSRRRLTEQDVREAQVEAVKCRERYETERRELEEHAEKRKEPRWYCGITGDFRRMKWNEGVEERYRLQQAQPAIPVEVHVLRLGDVAFATNPFELYLDYGTQIKARSPAVQIFLVQLAGSGTYLPTPRAVAGKSYGAVAASTPVGPEGGRELVEKTVGMIQSLWGG